MEHPRARMGWFVVSITERVIVPGVENSVILIKLHT